MPALDDVTNLGLILRAGLWTLAICGITKAVFWSLPNLELVGWVKRYRNGKLHVLRMMKWELDHNTTFTRERAKAIQTKDRLVDLPALTSEQVLQRSTLLQQNLWRSLPLRAVLYYLECTFCQCFGVALVLLALFGEPSFCGWLVSSFAYAFVSGWLAGVRRPAPDGRQQGCSDGSC